MVKTPSQAAHALRTIRPRRHQLVQPVTSVVSMAKSNEPGYFNTRQPDDRDAVQNPHKVNRDMWRKWDGKARRAFNSLFSVMMRNQSLFHHPKQANLEPKYWETVAHNAAWAAAEATMGHYSGDEMGVNESARAETRVAGKTKPKAAPKPKAKPTPKKVSAKKK